MRPARPLHHAIAAVTLALSAAPALAMKPFSANYTATYMGLRGPARMSITPAGDKRWTYQVSVDSAIAQLSQSTTFEDRNGQWRPLTSSDSSSLLVKKTSITANYDWDKRQATWSGDVKPDRSGPVELRDGDMDALLLNLAVARDAGKGEPMTYRMVDDGRARELTYQIEGQEPLDIGGKRVSATKVSRNHGDRQTIIWVVDGLPAPARILQRKGGKDDIELRIDSLK